MPNCGKIKKNVLGKGPNLKHKKSCSSFQTLQPTVCYLTCTFEVLGSSSHVGNVTSLYLGLTRGEGSGTVTSSECCWLPVCVVGICNQRKCHVNEHSK